MSCNADAVVHDVAFVRDACAFLSQRRDLRACTCELRVERVEVEQRGVDALRERSALALQVALVLCAADRRKGTCDAQADGDGERTGRESRGPSHEGARVPGKRRKRRICASVPSTSLCGFWLDIYLAVIRKGC